MNEDRIAIAVARMDTSDAAQIEAAWAELRPLGFGVVPYLREAYPTFAHWHGRTALVYHATRYARVCDAAVELALLALADRSYMVRYRACDVLAYSLRKDCIKALRTLADAERRDLVRESAEAAIAAIEAGDHHRYVDRSRSGRSFWEVNPGDREPRPRSLLGRLGAVLRR